MKSVMMIVYIYHTCIHTYIYEKNNEIKMLKVVNLDEGDMGIISTVPCNCKFEIIPK